MGFLVIHSEAEEISLESQLSVWRRGCAQEPVPSAGGKGNFRNETIKE